MKLSQDIILQIVVGQLFRYYGIKQMHRYLDSSCCSGIENCFNPEKIDQDLCCNCGIYFPYTTICGNNAMSMNGALIKAKHCSFRDILAFEII